MTDQPVGFLTPEEHQAMDLSADLWNTLCKIVGDGPTRDADLNELIAPIHLIQRYVMSQAAARAYPGDYRLLGSVIEDEEPSRRPRLGLALPWECPGCGRAAMVNPDALGPVGRSVRCICGRVSTVKARSSG